MASKTVTAETGTVGATVVQGTSIGGDTIDLIAKAGAGTVKIGNTPMHGTKSVRFDTSAATDQALMGLTPSPAPAAGLEAIGYLRLDALPASNTDFLAVRNASATPNMAKMYVGSNGRVSVQDNGNTVLFTAPATGGAITAAAYYRYHLLAIPGTGTADGQVFAACYSGDSTTPVWSYSSTTANTGTVPAVSARVFKIATTGGIISGDVDDFRVNPDVTTLSGPITTNSAPTAVMSSSITGLAVAVSAAGSSDADGTIASYGWNFGDSGTATGVTASHTYAAAGTYTITLTVTDNLGGTGTATQTVTVAPVKTYVPANDTGATTTGWTKVPSGAASFAATQGDLDDTTYIESTANPTNVVYQTAIPDVDVPADLTTVKIRARGATVSATSGSVILGLYQSGTLIAQSAPLPLTATPAWNELALTSAQASAIAVTGSKWQNLSIRKTYTAA